MKVWILSPLFFALVSTFVFAKTNETIRTADELRDALRQGQIGSHFDLTAVVTRPPKRAGDIVFLQDATGAVSAYYHGTNDTATISPGTKFKVSGKINIGQFSGNPAADCDSFTLLSTGKFPQPLEVKAIDLCDEKTAHRFVRVSGTVTDAFYDELDNQCTFIILNSEGTLVYLACPSKSAPAEPHRLVGAIVTADGFGIKSGTHRWITAKGVGIPNTSAIRIVRPPPVDPFDVPDISPSDSAAFPADAARRADGRVIAVWNHDKVLIKNDKQLVKGELSVKPPACGENITLLGHPETDLFHPMLVRARWRKSTYTPTHPRDLPVDASVRDLYAGDPTCRHYDYSYHGRPIRIRGTVHSLPIKGGDNRFFIESDGILTAIDITSCPAAASQLQRGEIVSVTGTCVMESEKITLNKTIPRITGFVLAVHSPTAIVVTKRLPWWTTTRLTMAISALLAAFLAVFIWNITLHRLVTKRSNDLIAERLYRRESELKFEERTRLSVELHDSISQSITGACLQINAAQDFFKTDPNATLRHLGIAAKTLVSCRNELKDCIWDLRSQALEKADMNSAILRTLEPYVSGIKALTVRFNVSRQLLSDNTAHAILRIIRELVTNAVRHGNASSIRIAGCTENGHVLFSVHDNGIGFDFDSAPGISEGHFGLQGIRERIKDLGGSIAFSRPRGVGTKVSIAINLQTEESN